MWNPESIKITNFLSHPESEFSFPKDDLTLIFGKNEDDKDSGANSNGSGKSVLIEAVTTALTGSTYRDIGKDDFILDGEDVATIDFQLDNPFLKKQLRIFWEFERGKAAKIKIFENRSTTHKKSIVSVNEAKKYILEEIGVSREDLLNFFIINQGNTNSFFTAGDAKQKEIIGRFANYGIVNTALDKISKEKDDLVLEKGVIDKNKFSQEKIIESMQDLIQEESENAEVSIKDQIKSLDVEIEEIDKERNGFKISIPTSKETLEVFKGELKDIELEITQFDEIMESAEAIKVTVSEEKTKKIKINSRIKAIKATVEHSINCPECKHEFLLDSDKSIEELSDELDQKKADLKNSKEIIEENETLLEEIGEHGDVLKDFKNQKRKKKNAISELEDDIESDERSLKALGTKEERVKNEKKILLEETEEKSNIPTYRSKIQTAEDTIESLGNELDTVNEKIELKDYWLVHLGKKGFQTFLANKCISTIEALCNNYLSEMRVNLRVKINGYKTTAAGELREKIEILIVKDGATVAKFNRFSGGQKERINLSGILALQKLINNSLKGGGLNLLILDESLDGLDDMGQAVCLGIIDRFDLTTMVISHNSLENVVEEYNKILVSFKNGESQIV